MQSQGNLWGSSNSSNHVQQQQYLSRNSQPQQGSFYASPSANSSPLVNNNAANSAALYTQLTQQQQQQGPLDPRDFPELGAPSGTNYQQMLQQQQTFHNSGLASSQRHNGGSTVVNGNASNRTLLNGPPGLIGTSTANRGARNGNDTDDFPALPSSNTPSTEHASIVGNSNSASQFISRNGSDVKAASAGSKNSTSLHTDIASTGASTNSSHKSAKDTKSNTNSSSAKSPNPIIKPENIDKFGMSGLLSVLKMENNDETAVAIGNDINSLAIIS